MKAHGENYCPEYEEKVIPDEKGNCSLCGASLEATRYPYLEEFMAKNIEFCDTHSMKEIKEAYQFAKDFNEEII